MEVLPLYLFSVDQDIDDLNKTKRELFKEPSNGFFPEKQPHLKLSSLNDLWNVIAKHHSSITSTKLSLYEVKTITRLQ
jgi:hypothetical protein